ncbi:MAG: hydroxyacid dehydrogenase [Clostridia bacterium]|nr:hydroxyacid dehydrogenase [Clostridia bacterium]
MNIAVLDAGTLGDDLNLDTLKEFGTLCVYKSTTPEEIAKRLKDAEVAVVNKVPIGAAALAAAPGLRLICVAATGYDNIEVGACLERGVGVCNVAGYSTDSVAQITAASVLYLACRYGEYVPFVKDGSYTASFAANKVSPPFYELRGKTWGIVGYGNIGKQVGRIAAAFGCRVLACKRTPEEGVECADIDRLCRESDIITLHTPLTPETKGLISKSRISTMKKGVILVNAARGAVADEAALAEALESGHIGGLGIDVYSKEPMPAEHPLYPLRHLPSLCLTPHMAWAAFEARQRCLDEICENIRSFLKGERRSRVDL